MSEEITFTRYIVAFCKKDQQKKTLYTAIGTGATDDLQFAHLYTTEKLAEKEATSRKKWYVKVRVVPVEVKWPILHLLTK